MNQTLQIGRVVWDEKDGLQKTQVQGSSHQAAEIGSISTGWKCLLGFVGESTGWQEEHGWGELVWQKR